MKQNPTKDELLHLLKWFRKWVNNDRFMDEVYECTTEAIRIQELCEETDTNDE